MKRMIFAATFGILGGSASNAEIILEKVATPCGTPKEVHDILKINMPSPRTIGKGGDSQGNEIAILFTGDNYWALVATMSVDRLCIVASGRTWQVIDDGGKSF